MGFVDGILFADKKKPFPSRRGEQKILIRKNLMKMKIRRRFFDRNDLFQIEESICILIQSICISRICCRHTD